MGAGIARVTLALGASLGLTLAAASTGVAQDTTETTIAFLGEAGTSAVTLALDDDGEGDPQLSLDLALTGSTVTSQGPRASGFGQVAGHVDASRAETEAPPDQSETAGAPGESGTVADLIDFDIGAGTANSESLANGGVSTESDATAGDITLGLADDPPVELFDFAVAITGLASGSSAAATPSPAVASTASATGAQITVEVDAAELADLLGEEGVGQVCTAIGGAVSEEAGDACDQVLGAVEPPTEVELLSATIADAECATSWDGETPTAAGSAQAVELSLFGSEIVTLEEGESVVIAEGTELETRLGAGIFTRTIQDGAEGEEDAASARSSGALAELFAGRVALALGDATCSVAGRISVEAVIARTGAEAAPVMVGGPLLAAAGYVLRRFLKRGRRRDIPG